MGGKFCTRQAWEDARGNVMAGMALPGQQEVGNIGAIVEQRRRALRQRRLGLASAVRVLRACHPQPDGQGAQRWLSQHLHARNVQARAVTWMERRLLKHPALLQH